MPNLGLMGENEEMSKRLEKIDKIYEVVIEVRTNQKNHDVLIQKHDKDLYGKDGLNTQVALIGQKVGIISAVIGGAVSLITTGIIAVFRGK
jgi:hypothetical protein